MQHGNKLISGAQIINDYSWLNLLQRRELAQSVHYEPEIHQGAVVLFMFIIVDKYQGHFKLEITCTLMKYHTLNKD